MSSGSSFLFSVFFVPFCLVTTKLVLDMLIRMQVVVDAHQEEKSKTVIAVCS